jgi:hypothetical protein
VDHKYQAQLAYQPTIGDFGFFWTWTELPRVDVEVDDIGVHIPKIKWFPAGTTSWQAPYKDIRTVGFIRRPFLMRTPRPLGLRLCRGGSRLRVLLFADGIDQLADDLETHGVRVDRTPKQGLLGRP